MSQTNASFDIVSFCMDWEGGEMDPQAEADGFQHLVDSRIVLQLQGAYGRQAARLISDGSVKDTHGDFTGHIQK